MTTQATVRTPRVSGIRVANETFWHGLRTDGLLISGTPGSDIAKFTFNRRTAFVLKHPDYVDHVLHEAVDRYHKSIEYELLRSVVGVSLFTDEDESWRRHRMTLNPVLAKRHLTSLFELMLAPVETFMERLDDGADRIELVMTHAMTELTLDVVGSALFGHGMADLARRIGPSVTAGLRAAERATRLMLLANPPVWLVRLCAGFVDRAPMLPPPLGRLHRIMRTIDTMVWDVIHDRQAHPDDTEDLLGLLLSARDENGQPLPLRRVRDEAATFMLAGHETTANALSWMWYLLALNPDARDRMLEEVDAVLGDGHRPTLEDVAKLKWTQACFEEAMRVFPPAWVLPRKCIAEDVIDGHRIKQGATILIPIHTLHHDERFWPDPEVFDPTRFLPENVKSHHRSAYLPFGGGRRVCAGKAFALIEGTLVTAMMSRQFVYDLVPGHAVEPEATLTLRPRHGLKMVARRRGAATTAIAAAA
ncbi:MAG TPA: cytochrome P450 [Solirubrobacteraceae bacterium]|nr:cytochrome P450 [Solirubrobacteraceae bacterium]